MIKQFEKMKNVIMYRSFNAMVTQQNKSTFNFVIKKVFTNFLFAE